MSTIEVIRSTLATGGPHLGDIVFWALADARLARQQLEAIWSGAGLTPELLPDAPTAERAFKVAVREMQIGQQDRLLRLSKESADEIVFAIVREHRPGDGTVSYNQEARVILDRQREVVTTDLPGHDLVAGVQSRYQGLLVTHTSDDIRRAINRALDSWAAVTLRESGGVYWVPSPYGNQLRRLQVAIEKIGTSRFHLVPEHRSDEAQRTLGEVAAASIESELAALKTEVEGFLAAPPDRASTLERRLEAFETLRGRALLYHAVLSTEVTGLEDGLARLTTSVSTLLAARKAA